MKDTKLIEILSTFSDKEMKSFEKFVASPYFERQRDVSGLFSLLKKYYPGFDANDLEKEKIYSKLFPGEKLNEKKLKNISFELTKLAEQFLIHNSVSSNKIECERLLALEYKERKREKLFFITINSLEKKLDNLLIDEYKFFHGKEESSHLRANFYFWKSDFDNTIKYELKYTEHLTLSFLVRFLRKLISKTVITSRYNKEFSNPLFDSVYESLDFEKLLDTLKKKKYSYLWLIEIYYHAYRCSDNSIENEDNFKRLKKLFYENIERFSDPEKQGIFIDLTHYCTIRRDEKNDSNYEREKFEIYKKILQNYSRSSVEKEFFNIVLYRSIMTTGLELDEYEWLKDFMEKYTKLLKPELRSNMEYLMKAHLDFAGKRFNESLENISKIKYDIFLYKVDVKNLMLKNYYELGLYDQAYSLIDAYKHFLTENKDYGELQQKYYGNFINIYGKLLRVKESGKKEMLDALSNDPHFESSLPSYKWLNQKFTELREKYM